MTDNIDSEFLRDVADLAERLRQNRRFRRDIFGNPYGSRPVAAVEGADDVFRVAVDSTAFHDD